jgi:hypothetical protein
VEESLEEKALFPRIRAHLGLEEDPVRYGIRLLPDPDEPATQWVIVDDRIQSIDFSGIKKFPSYVSKEIPKRTVWINPPIEKDEDKDENKDENKDEEGDGASRAFTKKKYYPWNACYMEYFQLYCPEHPEQQTLTIRYWKTFEQLEMIHPTDLANARYEWLRPASSASSSGTTSCLSPSCPLCSLCQGDLSYISCLSRDGVMNSTPPSIHDASYTSPDDTDTNDMARN